jgi:succinate dehydrogenase/fumarate reductase flavoprotein subunit
MEISWDRETDLIVAGAGPAGMTAALVAALEGLEVIICEKSQQVGGTGATSAGTLWIPGNTQSKMAGYEDSATDAAKYLDSFIGDDEDKIRRRVYLEEGPKVIDYLMERTDVKFNPCGKHPDYRNNIVGAAVEGRAILPKQFNGRKLGKNFERVRPPIEEFMLFGGMMVGKDDIARLTKRYESVTNFAFSASIFLRFLIDRLWYKRGTRLTMGNALVARLFYSLCKQNVPILFGAPVIELVNEQSGVIGAVIETQQGRKRIRGKKGVVLSTGGFSHNKEFREKYLPKPISPYSLATESNTGDGLRIGESIGAKLDDPPHQRSAFWTPVSITKRKDGTAGLFPHIFLDRAKPGLIAVNAGGQRFVNEAASYHDFVEAMYRSHENVATIPAWLVCDSYFVQKYGIGTIYPGTKNLQKFAKAGYVRIADTISNLAKSIGISGTELENTIMRHNEFASNGIDLDFGKGDLELNRFNGDSDNRPNPCLRSIETAPFVAMPVWPAELGCSIGLKTNINGQVLDQNNENIAGLYACGNDMASIMAGCYPGPGITLGPAVVFGYRVAMHAAGRL